MFPSHDPCFLAVIIPTESIFVTSSYVNVPAMDTLPLKVALPVKVDTPDIFKFDAVTTPTAFTPLAVNIPTIPTPPL